VLGGRVGLEQGEEGVLEREVAGIAGGVDLRVPRDLPRVALDPDEALLIQGEAVVADAGPLRRSRREEVEALHAPVAERRRVRAHLRHALAGARLDAAVGELLREDLVHQRPRGLGEGRLVRQEGELDLLAHALATKPRVEHERHFVQRHRPPVVSRDGEQHALPRALARAPANAQEALVQQTHRCRVADAEPMLVQPGNRLRPRCRAGGDHQMLVREPAPWPDVHPPGVRVDALDPSVVAGNALAGERVGEVEGGCGGVGAERHVDEVRPQQERVGVMDDVHVGAAGQAPREQERRLEPGDTGAEHDHTRQRRDHAASLSAQRMTARHTNRVIA
jgi:hypothetical protein